MEIEHISRISNSYLVRIWKENPADPWQYWVKTIADNKEFTFSNPEAFHEFFESELFDSDNKHTSQFLK